VRWRAEAVDEGYKMKIQRHNKQLKVGDLVVRTYGEGQRPMALIVGLYGHREFENIDCYDHSVAELVWLGSNRITEFETKFLEIARCKSVI
jgi:hypothetical protein